MKKSITVPDNIIPEIKVIAQRFQRTPKQQLEFWVKQGYEKEKQSKSK